MSDPRHRAALPSYLRAIVTDLYAAHAIPVAEQVRIEQAMSLLMEDGKRFCVDFGVLNAVEMAERAGWAPTTEKEGVT